MRLIHDDTIMELTRRVRTAGQLQQGEWLYAFRQDYDSLLDIAAAAIRAAQELNHADSA